MPSRVREHTPPVVAGLLRRLRRSSLQQSGLGQVEIVHLEVQVGLLRLALSRPVWRTVVHDSLEPHEEPGGTPQAREVTVRAVGELQPCRMPVEGSEFKRIGSVKCDHREGHEGGELIDHLPTVRRQLSLGGVTAGSSASSSTASLPTV